MECNKDCKECEYLNGRTDDKGYRSTKKSKGYKKIGTTKKTSYVDRKGLKSKKTYYYKIRAKLGNVVSKYSSVVKAKVK